ERATKPCLFRQSQISTGFTIYIFRFLAKNRLAMAVGCSSALYPQRIRETGVRMSLARLGLVIICCTPAMRAQADLTINVTPHSQSPGWTHLTITGMSVTAQYDVQRSADLATWEPITSVASNTGAISIDDPGVLGRAFYRVLLSSGSTTAQP